MRDTSLRSLAGAGPAVDKSNLVGATFGAGIEENWNGSAWAEMYGDFGIAGLFIAAVAIAILLRLYDGTTKRAPFPLVCAMAGYAAYVWGETAVTTSILTYGVLATLMLLSHYRRPPRRSRSYEPAPSDPGRTGAIPVARPLHAG
jgi:heme exporter protein D